MKGNALGMKNMTDKAPTLIQLHVGQILSGYNQTACLPQLSHLLAMLFEQVTLISVPKFLFCKYGY